METAPARVKASYTTGARSLASRAVTRLLGTRITPNALTATGVSLCLVAAVLVPFENRDKLLFYWLGAGIFVVGSVLDILDGALARAGGLTTPFGAFLDSTTDRVGEGFVLGAIALTYINYELIPNTLNGLPGKLGLQFQLTDLSFGIFGFLLVIMMIVRPGGLLPERRRRIEMTEGVGADEALVEVTHA